MVSAVQESLCTVANNTVDNITIPNKLLLVYIANAQK